MVGRLKTCNKEGSASMGKKRILAQKTETLLHACYGRNCCRIRHGIPFFKGDHQVGSPQFPHAPSTGLRMEGRDNLPCTSTGTAEATAMHSLLHSQGSSTSWWAIPLYGGDRIAALPEGHVSSASRCLGDEYPPFNDQPIHYLTTSRETLCTA